MNLRMNIMLRMNAMLKIDVMLLYMLLVYENVMLLRFE